MIAQVTFAQFFQKSFENTISPEDYQTFLADAPPASRLINIPTGLGKTAAVIHAWLWNRVHLKRQYWPRRLVYCLPMRTLVEQTQDSAKKWLAVHNLLWTGGMDAHEGKVGLHMLMGGEMTTPWDLHPEADAILIGTQDMLLSRALNRGYGMSRFRWPMHYGLLNNDCLWVFDEVQLMGAGLPTTAQLEAFRSILGSEKPCHSWWMSATNAPAWLSTVDFDPSTLASPVQLEQPYSQRVVMIREARKTVAYCQTANTDTKKLCAEILNAARNRGALTLVVVNTVRKAKEISAELTKQQARSSAPVPTVLLHSQFRPRDRQDRLQRLLGAEKSETPVIAISTQIVEAGVDISARTLFTEMAPWSSLVQRFGRCNRRGTETNACVFIIPTDKPTPYEATQLSAAKDLIDHLIAFGANASPKNLAETPIPECDKPESNHIIRRRDFLDLFDTTPDLAGQDIDIDRWVREIEDTGIQLFWRVWEGSEKNRRPPDTSEFPSPHRDELCPAPIGKETRDWLEKRKITPFRWDHLAGEWSAVTKEYGKLLLIPGQVYLIPAQAGGYTATSGFDPGHTASVDPVVFQDRSANESNESDRISQSSWQSIATHTGHVCAELDSILTQTDVSLPALPLAARWHDIGKAHSAFEAKIKADFLTSPDADEHKPLAKAPLEAWRPHRDTSDPNHRNHFRHELASALAALHPATPIPDESRDLVAWLIACHHGKIRLSIRSLPDESQPSDPNKRFARGIWDGDPLPSVNLGGGITSPVLELSLEPMEIGLCMEPPFEGQSSWTDRMLALRDSPVLGPLRLAYWESLLRAADARASARHP